jgi:hypothetical protein
MLKRKIKGMPEDLNKALLEDIPLTSLPLL